MSAYPQTPPPLTSTPPWSPPALELPGLPHRAQLASVRGIIVRSRNVLATIGAGLQTILGRQHHPLHSALRKDPPGRLGHDDGARRPARSQRHRHGPLRRQRTHAGRHQVLAYAPPGIVEKL